MDIAQARTAAAGILKGAREYRGTEADRGWVAHNLPIDQFPVPELLRFALRELCDLTPWGPGEKLRWGFTIEALGTPFSVTHEKFGPNAYLPPQTPPPVCASVIEALASLTKIAELVLLPQAAAQIEAANVTIDNRMIRMDSRYRFFRDNAAAAFASPSSPLNPILNESGERVGVSGNLFRPRVVGGYLAGSMIDAYFSMLEHLLVLVLAFLDFDPENGRLKAIASDTWTNKYKAVFALNSNDDAKRHYDRLMTIREQYRNPSAHGDFGKNGTSFYFHVAGVGALPALLSRQSVSPEIFITPIPQSSFDEICTSFDQCDQLFWTQLPAATEFARSGLDVVFSKRARAEYKEAAQSRESLIAFMDRQSYLSDRDANMDY